MSTDQVAEPDRFDFWMSEVSRCMPVILDSHPMSRAAFHGNAHGYALGTLHLNSLSAGPMRVRHHRHVGQDESDYYKLVLQIAGSVRVEHDGVRSHLMAGDLALFDTTRPYALTYDGDFRTIVAMLPRPTIPLSPPTLRAVTGNRIPAQSVTASAVSSLLQSLTSPSSEVSAPAAPRLVEGTVSLITALLAEELSVHSPATSPSATLMRAREYVELHLSDPDLGPDQIAGALGVSRRYLYNVFAETGTPVSGWIRKRRLDMCARDLAHPTTRGQSIAVIASRWGLVDARHFSRLFRVEYGCTPREYRH